MNRMKTFGTAIAILLSIAVVVTAIYAGRLYYISHFKPQSAFSPVPEASSAETSPSVLPSPSASLASPTSASASPSTPTPIPVDENFMKQKVNILLVGWDESPERTNEKSALYRDEKNNFRSDVLMLLAIDFDTKKADLISIPRDSYAEIYQTKGKWKINAAFAKGGSAQGDGFEYAMKTVSMLMGEIPIDHYVGVNMTGIKALVDAMGGVDYDVDVRIELNRRVLETGPQHLTGQQVLDYCRARKGISTDVGRIDRQQRILLTIFDQMQSSGQLRNLPDIYQALKDMVYTNLNLEQIAALAVFANNLSLENDIRRHTLEGEYLSAYGIQFYVLRQSAKNNLVEELYGFKPTFDKKHDLSYVRGEAASRRRAAAAVATQIPAEQEEKSALPNDETLIEETPLTSVPEPLTESEAPASATLESSNEPETTANDVPTDIPENSPPDEPVIVIVPEPTEAGVSSSESEPVTVDE